MPSTASAPGTTPSCIPRWLFPWPTTPTGPGTSPSCTATPPWFPPPGGTGSWRGPTPGGPGAPAHVEASWPAARAFGTGTGVTTAAMADAELALARGDLVGVLSATAVARALGRAEVSGVADWRPLEVEALIGLGRLDDAEAALAELDAAIPACGLASASMTAARLHGDLAVLRGGLA